MRTNTVIRCRRLRGRKILDLRNMKIKIVVYDVGRDAGCFLTEKLQSIAKANKIPLITDVITRADQLLEGQSGVDIIFYVLRGTIEEELQIVRKLKRKHADSRIILIAEDGTYIKEAYKVQPFRYLYISDSVEEIQEAVISAVKENRERHGIALESDGRYFYVLLKDILYIEALGDDIGITTVRYEKYIIRMTLKNMHFLLENDFIRVSRQRIVNAEHINMLKCDEVILDDGEKITISTRERKRVEALYVEYISRVK